MVYFAGLRGSGSFGTDERPKSFREMILWMNPNGLAPIFALSSKAKEEAVDDPEFAWWEEINTICRLRLNDADNMAAGDTAVVVDSGALELNVGDILQVEKTQDATYTNELVRVTAVTSDTAFTIARGAANTTAASIPHQAYFTRVGSAYSEGSGSPNSSTNNPTKLKNYTQIFKTPYQVTNTAKATRFRTGDGLKNDQKRASFRHSEKIEQALLWGKAYETTDAGNGGMPIRYTGGIRQFITSNVKIFTADPTIDEVEAEFAKCFDYECGEAGNERLCMMGNEAMTWLNNLVRSNGSTRITYDGIVKFYGMSLQRWTIPQGTLYIKSHPLLNVHPVYKSSIFTLNGAGIIWRPLRGRDTHIQKNIQAPDEDKQKDQWLTEGGFEFHFERTWGYMGNVKNF